MQLGKASGDRAGGKGRCSNRYAFVSTRSPALDSVEDEVSSEQSPEGIVWPREKLVQVVSGGCREQEVLQGQEPSAGIRA